MRGGEFSSVEPAIEPYTSSVQPGSLRYVRVGLTKAFGSGVCSWTKIFSRNIWDVQV